MSKLRFVQTVMAAMAMAGLSTGFVALAQETQRQPNIAHGAEIAAQGTKGGATACAQCHAFNGSSDGTGAFPRIAGQSAMYLGKQLGDFASGDRASAVMSPIAKLLSADDIADVAAYFASVSGPYLPLANVDAALFKRGQELATIGDAKKNLQSCNNCHGPGGTGEPPSIPYLAGQYGRYTAFQLHMWQRGFRKTSPQGMAEVAKKVSDEDIAAVAAYFQQIRDANQADSKPKE